MRRILLLFILSFLCVIYTVNHLSYRYIDNRIDTHFIEVKYQTHDVFKINEQIREKNIRIISENTRLIITLSTSALILLAMLFVNSGLKYVFLVLFLIAYFIAYRLFAEKLIFINCLSPILGMLIAPYFASTYKRVFVNEEGNRIERILGKYISKDVKNKILKNTQNDQLGGKKAEISIMFADIRGFTSLSESHSAEEVTKLLNEYFTELEPIIIKYNGVINKFIGDAILVIFGEPIQDKEHAKNAVLCATELSKKVKRIQERWLEEGKPKIDIGIAVNTGEAFVGNVGTANRFEFAVIGDSVNIASRIEDYNKIYKTHILISESTYQKISHFVDVIKIREVAIKGKAKKITIYEVLRITG